jgi:hypothetical protein
MSIKRSCATCNWFHEEGVNPQAVNQKTYTCRAYPPQMVPVGPSNIVSMFPFARPEGWCAEWEKREERGGTA